MVEIFNYSSSIYEQHSSNSKIINDFRKEIHMEPVVIRDVAKHAQILDMTPKPSALTSLLQTNKKTEWAFFSPPKNFHTQRFNTPYLAPSLGSPEQQDDDINKVVEFLKIMTKGKFYYQSKARPIFYRPSDEETFEDDDYEEYEEPSENEHESSLIEEGTAIIKALDLGLKSTNIMIDYVISRIFQFVQG